MQMLDTTAGRDNDGERRNADEDRTEKNRHKADSQRCAATVVVVVVVVVVLMADT